MLSPAAREFGEAFYKHVTGTDMAPPPGAMKYSVEQHLDLVQRLLPRQYTGQSEFWKIVTTITWTVLAIEKDPMLAAQIRESDDPESILAALEYRSKQ